MSQETVQKWLEAEINHYACMHERHGGVPLSTLIGAFDPDKATVRHKQIQKECPAWLLIPSRERGRIVRTTLNAMVTECRLKTTDDAIDFLDRMLKDNHAPEPSYVPVNVLDRMVERMQSDDA